MIKHHGPSTATHDMERAIHGHMMPRGLSSRRIIDSVEDTIFDAVSGFHCIVDIGEKSAFPGLHAAHSQHSRSIRPALSVIISVDPNRSLPKAPFSWTYHWIRWSFLFQIDSDSECPAWADGAHTQKFEQTWTNPQTWTLVLVESIESLAQVGMYDDRCLGVSCFNQQLAESPP